MTKEEVKSVAIPGIVGLILMVGVGAVFRMFIGRQSDTSATETAVVSAGAAPGVPAVSAEPEPEPERLDPPAVCLARPLAQWTASEASAYPQVRCWLEDQARRILPWEWSNAALTKDPSGYCRLWRELCWELETRMLVKTVARNWASGAGVKALVGDADLRAVAELRRAYETEEQLCGTDAPPTAEDLRRLETKAFEGLLQAILRLARRTP